MPKINLLQQATPDSGSSKSSPISAQTGQLIAMIVVVALGVLAWISYVWYTTDLENKRVKENLANEQKVAAELAKLKEDADKLQKQIVLVQNRVKVIKQLRAEQRGPVAVLSNINERIPLGVNLDTITQRGTAMTIAGNTATEALITSFAKDLEFSNGLFTGVEVQTEQLPITATTTEPLTKFTIRCVYNPPVATPKPTDGQTASIQ
ncbi:MAG: PilN domain-containing protein [Blastocatellia bacterium]|nr:PilN domain-containing protein [Blastocatellia bacterium]MBN8724322.1 PilN domain-containing protein [Acidobacteriota bacterium]